MNPEEPISASNLKLEFDLKKSICYRNEIKEVQANSKTKKLKKY